MVRHVPARALDAQHVDLIAVEVGHAHLHGGVAAAVQHKLRVLAEQARRVDAQRKIARDAVTRVAGDSGFCVACHPRAFHRSRLSAPVPPAEAARLCFRGRVCGCGLRHGHRRLRRRCRRRPERPARRSSRRRKTSAQARVPSSGGVAALREQGARPQQPVRADAPKAQAHAHAPPARTAAEPPAPVRPALQPGRGPPRSATASATSGSTPCCSCGWRSWSSPFPF